MSTKQHTKTISATSRKLTVKHARIAMLLLIVTTVVIGSAPTTALASLVDPGGGSGLNVVAAERLASHYDHAGVNVGFAVISDGSYIANYNQSTQNSGGSLTKVLLLSAYLKQHSNAQLSGTATTKLTAMIEKSDNSASNWVYSHLKNPNSSIVAAAGSSQFKLVVHNGHSYVIGESTVTAYTFANFFSNLGARFPSRHRAFALNLLAHVSPKVGILKAGLSGTVYSKEGWTDLDRGYPGYPYIVNQAAQFHSGGVTYGVAVTVGNIRKGSYSQDQAYGQAVIRNIVSKLNS